METQCGRTETHPQGAQLMREGAIAIIQDVACGDRGKCWQLLCEIKERQQ